MSVLAIAAVTTLAHSPARLTRHASMTPQRLHAPRRSSHLSSRIQGVGKDAVGSWLDLAGFVASTGGKRTPYDELADKIGRDCYIDVAGWHLYLKDVKLGGQASLAQGLAMQLGAQIDGQGFKEADVAAVLGKVPIKFGQGKATLALAEVMPAGCVRDLTDVCEEYARRR